MRALALAGLLLLAAAAPAVAAPPWSAPVPTLPAGAAGGLTSARAFADGSRLVTWEVITGKERCAEEQRIGSSRVPAEGMGAPNPTRAGLLVAGPSPLPGARSATVERVGCAQPAALRILDPRGRPVRSVALARALEDAVVDTADPTRIRVIYSTYHHIGGAVEGRDVVSLFSLTTRTDGSRPVRRRLADLRGVPFDDRILQDLVLGVGANGTRVVAFAESRCPRTCVNDVRAAVARPGRGYGPFRRLGGSDEFTRVAATVTSQGRPVVAWGWQDGGEAGDRPWQVAAASADAAGRWTRAQRLDPGDRADRPGGDVGVTAGNDGTATVVWTGVPPQPESDLGPLRAATSRPDGTFPVVARGRRYRRLPISGAALGLLTARDGTTTLLTSNRTDSGLMAIRRAPGAAAFGVPEVVIDGREAPLLVLDPRSGVPSVLLSAPGFPRVTRADAAGG